MVNSEGNEELRMKNEKLMVLQEVRVWHFSPVPTQKRGNGIKTIQFWAGVSGVCGPYGLSDLARTPNPETFRTG
jgi:hypothetical protein